MYKDKDKQREADKERQRRYKAKQKALLNEGVTDKALPKGRDVCMFLPKKVPKRGKDIKYQMTVMERLFYRPANELKQGEHNFVSLPGRVCYGVH